MTLKRVLILLLANPLVPVLASRTSPSQAIAESKYARAHSLGDDYLFDPRDGWNAVNATNLQYKYKRQSDTIGEFPGNAVDRSSVLISRSAKKSTHRALTKANHKSLGNALKGLVSSVFAGLKGLGKPEPVTITWYSGHDLKNPSCWTRGSWAPTDESFAAALTLEGWVNRPKCFTFLELCNNPKKCVFVRVVDTCAGCAKGSKHVDLTRAAFGQLADFDEGILQVQLRIATEPKGWLENLWGPKVHNK